jgi:hypothetical protein
MGLYDVEQGSIVVDGVPLPNLDMHWWRRQLGVVMQDPGAGLYRELHGGCTFIYLASWGVHLYILSFMGGAALYILLHIVHVCALLRWGFGMDNCEQLFCLRCCFKALLCHSMLHWRRPLGWLWDVWCVIPAQTPWMDCSSFWTLGALLDIYIGQETQESQS